jgi:rRNA-processing protein FCF1
MKDGILPFYTNSRVVRERDGLKTIPNSTDPVDRIQKKLEKARKKKKLFDKLKKLAELTNHRFICDEHCQINGLLSADGAIVNAPIFAFVNGLQENGLDDDVLLRLAIEQNFVIVTNDKGLILKSIQKNHPVVLYGYKGRISYIRSITVNVEDIDE